MKRDVVVAAGTTPGKLTIGWIELALPCIPCRIPMANELGLSRPWCSRSSRDRCCCRRFSVRLSARSDLITAAVEVFWFCPISAGGRAVSTLRARHYRPCRGLGCAGRGHEHSGPLQFRLRHARGPSLYGARDRRGDHLVPVYRELDRRAHRSAPSSWLGLARALTWAALNFVVACRYALLRATTRLNTWGRVGGPRPHLPRRTLQYSFLCARDMILIGAMRPCRTSRRSPDAMFGALATAARRPASRGATEAPCARFARARPDRRRRCIRCRRMRLMTRSTGRSSRPRSSISGTAC